MTTDKEIIENADRTKANLDAGVATHVPRGDEVAREKIDPMAARKAMFKKADSLRETEVANGMGADPERVAALQAEARGEVVASGAPTPAATPAGAPTGQPTNAYVTIPVAGGEIDREGGVDAYLRRREADEASTKDRIEITRLSRELADSRRQIEEHQQARPAGQADPAVSPADPAGRSNSSGASDTELAELATQLAKQIYSGDENDAKSAILEILRRSKGETLSAQDIEARIKSAVASQNRPATTAQTEAPVNPRIQAINDQINDMARREYADICNSDVARTASWSYFLELVKLPENRDRRAVDVARDACDWARRKFLADPNSKVVEQKRGLPSHVTASGATFATTEEEALTPAQVVAMQQSHRNFGRRIQNN
jgi:hypothetical protein